MFFLSIFASLIVFALARDLCPSENCGRITPATQLTDTISETAMKGREVYTIAGNEQILSGASCMHAKEFKDISINDPIGPAYHYDLTYKKSNGEQASQKVVLIQSKKEPYFIYSVNKGRKSAEPAETIIYDDPDFTVIYMCMPTAQHYSSDVQRKPGCVQIWRWMGYKKIVTQDDKNKVLHALKDKGLNTDDAIWIDQTSC